MRSSKIKILLLILINIALVFQYQSLSAKPLHNMDISNVIKPKIIYVVDGDTIKIRLKERDTNVRLTGIDCWETSVNKHIKYQRNQGLTDDEIISMGYKAKEELKRILRKHKDIYLEITGVDHYRRLVGILYYKDPKGNYVNINHEMMNTGYCPIYLQRKVLNVK